MDEQISLAAPPPTDLPIEHASRPAAQGALESTLSDGVTQLKPSRIMTIAPSTLEWLTKTFDRLTVNELYDVMQLRLAVFVVEQQCCYQDADALDQNCLHVLGRLPSGRLACYLRIVPPGFRYAEPSIGRVVVDNHFRGSGIGRSLMSRGIEITDTEYPTFGIRLSAQKYLERFYRSFGFSTAGDDYVEDGIPHVEMYRTQSSR